MVMQRIESGLRRGFENVGLVTPGMLVPKVTEALESYRDEGIREATAYQIRRKMTQLHPVNGWFPIAEGNLPGALCKMEREGEVKRNLVPYKDEAGARDIVVYSLAEQLQKSQITTS